MIAVTLQRIEPEQRMRRFYRLDVQPTLFGEWDVVREWGRIGSAGRVQCTPCPTQDAAIAALLKQRQAKERRGYAPIR